MAKFLFTAVGSYGDLHPVLALALELKGRGHDVTLATLDVYKDKVERTGLRFFLLYPRLEDLGPEVTWAAKAMHPLGGPRFVVRDISVAYLEKNYQALAEEAKQSDVLIGQALTFFVPLLAEVFKKPWVSLVLQPILFFSKHDPPTGGPLTLLTRFKFLTPLVRSGLRTISQGWFQPWREFRQKLGLSKIAPHPLFEGQFSPDLTLALFSPHFAKKQSDWPSKVKQTGFVYYDADASAELSPATAQFLRSGPPPLVFTLGTAAVMDAGDFFRKAAAAALSLDQRAILLVGRDSRNLEGLPQDPRLHVSEYEPYSKIFEKARIVVHQGGVGTTAQALRAGSPQLIHPFSHDQPDNAERARRLGVAHLLPKNQRGKFQNFLAKVLADDKLGPNARRWADALAREDGLNEAADAIERQARSK